MKPSEYSIQNICTAVMNEKNKSTKSKLKTLFTDIFSFSSTSGKNFKNCGRALKIKYTEKPAYLMIVPIFVLLDSEDDEGFKRHQEDADDFLIKKVCMHKGNQYCSLERRKVGIFRQTFVCLRQLLRKKSKILGHQKLQKIHFCYLLFFKTIQRKIPSRIWGMYWIWKI